jgi:hypothetical protein
LKAKRDACLLPLFITADTIVAPLNMFNLFPIYLRAEEAA